MRIARCPCAPRGGDENLALHISDITPKQYRNTQQSVCAYSRQCEHASSDGTEEGNECSGREVNVAHAMSRMAEYVARMELDRFTARDKMTALLRRQRRQKPVVTSD